MIKFKKIMRSLIAIALGFLVTHNAQALVVQSEKDLKEGDLVTIGSKQTGKILQFGVEQANWVGFQGARPDINSIFRVLRPGKNMIVFQCLANGMNIQSVPAKSDPSHAWVVRAENTDKGDWEQWEFVDGKYLWNKQTTGYLNNRGGLARTHGDPTMVKKVVKKGKTSTTTSIQELAPAGKIASTQIEINKINNEFQTAMSPDELVEGRVVAIKFLKSDKYAQLGGELPTWLTAKSTSPEKFESLFRIRRNGNFVGFECLANAHNVQSVKPSSLLAKSSYLINKVKKSENAQKAGAAAGAGVVGGAAAAGSIALLAKKSSVGTKIEEAVDEAGTKVGEVPEEIGTKVGEVAEKEVGTKVGKVIEEAGNKLSEVIEKPFDITRDPLLDLPEEAEELVGGAGEVGEGGELVGGVAEVSELSGGAAEVTEVVGGVGEVAEIGAGAEAVLLPEEVAVLGGGATVEAALLPEELAASPVLVPIAAGVAATAAGFAIPTAIATAANAAPLITAAVAAVIIKEDLAYPPYIVRAINNNFAKTTDTWEHWLAEFDADTAFLKNQATGGYLTLHYKNNDLIRTHGAMAGLFKTAANKFLKRFKPAKKDEPGARLQILVFGGAGLGSTGFRTVDQGAAAKAAADAKTKADAAAKAAADAKAKADADAKAKAAADAKAKAATDAKAKAAADAKAQADTDAAAKAAADTKTQADTNTQAQAGTEEAAPEKEEPAAERKKVKHKKPARKFMEKRAMKKDDTEEVAPAQASPMKEFER